MLDDRKVFILIVDADALTELEKFLAKEPVTQS
jgi:hypothetical protein